MPLSLLENTSSPAGFTGGLSIDNLTWWFWLKAGIGFTLGAGIAAIVWGVMWFFLLGGLGTVLLRALR